MTKLKVEIKVGNAATSTSEDIARMLESAAQEIRDHGMPPEQNEDAFLLETRTLMDYNGNVAGKYELVDEEFDKNGL